MKNWLDKQEFKCLICKHRWVIMSNKMITNEQHSIWIKETMQHHRKLCKGAKNENI